MNTSQQHQAAAMLGQGESVAATARSLGVARSTVTRWQRRPAFQQLIQGAQVETLEPLAQARRMLHQGAPTAVAVLLEQVADERLEPRDRRAAAMVLLDRAGLVPGSTVEVSARGEEESVAVQLLRSLHHHRARGTW
jgi:hypothetical protein